MHVIIDLCVVPVGVGTSVSAHIAACQRVIEAAGLSHQMHAYGTNIEGDWDTVMAVVKACHEQVHAMGAPRISTTMKLGTRVDRSQTMRDKVDSVRAKLGAEQPPGVPLLAEPLETAASLALAEAATLAGALLRLLGLELGAATRGTVDSHSGLRSKG
jgi:uncharacterized protein (TIGR00106 family)